MTHSAASQTAAQMARHGLLTLETGTDARQRLARLTDRAVLARPVRTRIADAAPALAAAPAPAGHDPEAAAGFRAALLAIAALIGLMFPAFGQYRSRPAKPPG